MSTTTLPAGPVSCHATPSRVCSDSRAPRRSLDADADEDEDEDEDAWWVTCFTVRLWRPIDANLASMSDALRDQTRLAYDTVAASYAQILPDTSYESPLDLAMIDHFVRQLGGRHVLDAGCGAGRMMTYLASGCESLTLAGVDLSPSMVERARAGRPEAHIEEGDLAALPFGGERFDGVLAWYSIIHSPPHELAPIFGEFRRVLRPGGLALIAYQAGTGVRDLTHAYGHDVELRAFLHQPPDVEAVLHATGFTVDSRLDRGARAAERHGQCFILATRS